MGVNLSQMEHDLKQQAYACDITYGTNNEFGFDYLRDNMVYQPSERVQRKLVYAIVDEVDSILIDEARTPLIISGQAEDTTELYLQMNRIAPKLVRQKEENGPGDYWVDEKNHQVVLSEEGHEHAEELLVEAGLLTEGSSLYDAHNITMMHHLNAALRARTPVSPRSALCRAERRGGHRRRVHRTPDARAALVGRPAPGGRGEGGRRDPAREPDARLDHLPELLPHVHQARRHDGHGGHRGLRIPADLQPRNGHHPDAP